MFLRSSVEFRSSQAKCAAFPFHYCIELPADRVCAGSEELLQAGLCLDGDPFTVAVAVAVAVAVFWLLAGSRVLLIK